MIDFEKIKSTVTVKEYAESIGMNVTSRGMTCCPFHNDKNPSMKVSEGYYCFGCGAKGDIINFVSELYGLTAVNAAKKIMNEYGIAEDITIKKVNQPVKIKNVSAKEKRNDAVLYFIKLEKELKRWIEEYKPKESDDSLHPLFVYAVNNVYYYEYVIDKLMHALFNE